MLVVDASVVVPACRVDRGLAELGDADLAAPALMWSEARAALHEAAWRGGLPREDALAAHARLEESGIRTEAPPGLGRAAWRIADQLRLAKTYDAEYVALAELLGCRLVTVDARLWRRTRELGFVVSPTEL